MEVREATCQELKKKQIRGKPLQSLCSALDYCLGGKPQLSCGWVENNKVRYSFKITLVAMREKKKKKSTALG